MNFSERQEFRLPRAVVIPYTFDKSAPGFARPMEETMAEREALPTMEEEDEEVVAEIEEEKIAELPNQAFWVMVHTLIAAGSWIAMLVVVTLFHPLVVPVAVTTALSFTVPFVVGNIFNRFKQNDMGPQLWLVAFIWFMGIVLWVLDMPTGPNECYHCDASQKIFFTFASFTSDSGLIDGQGRLVGTWPTVALIGYAIGSKMALKSKDA